MSLRDRAFRAPRARTFIASRIDRTLGRAYSLAILGTWAESSVNAFSELHLLNPVWFWFTWVWVSLSAIGIAIQQWFLPGGRYFYLSHSIAVLFTIFSWPLQVANAGALPPEFMPWIWWQFGMGLLTLGLSLRGVLAWPVLIVVPIYWVFLRVQEVGGEASLSRAIQDSTYTFLFAAVFLSLLNLLRQNARDADEAALSAANAMAAQAATEAAERERLRIDAIVHDNILTTLVAASHAKTASSFKSVKQQAQHAVESLDALRSASVTKNETVAVQSLFDAIQETVDTHFSSVEILSSGVTELQVSADVANAFTEATLQALENSVAHAGPGKVERQLIMKAQTKGFKLVVKDNGRGFRPSRVPKNRLGIRLAIRARIESVGGTLKLDTAPGAGCTVILEWVAK